MTWCIFPSLLPVLWLARKAVLAPPTNHTQATSSLAHQFNPSRIGERKYWCVNIYARLRARSIPLVWQWVHTCACVLQCTCIYMYMYMCVHTCMYAYVYVYVCAEHQSLVCGGVTKAVMCWWSCTCIQTHEPYRKRSRKGIGHLSSTTLSLWKKNVYLHL